jgi:hypothetical protein
MEQGELLRRVVDTLERLKLSYLVTGSIATTLYGEPRFTNDIDVVVQLPLDRAEALVQAFPADDFYVDAEQVRLAIARRGEFNIIHPASGLKVDVMIPAMDEFDLSRFARARRVRPAIGFEADFAAPEDVIVKKLKYYDDGGSEKHLRDIGGVLRISSSEVDRDYIATWAQRLGVLEVWKLILDSEDGEKAASQE